MAPFNQRKCSGRRLVIAFYLAQLMVLFLSQDSYSNCPLNETFDRFFGQLDAKIYAPKMVGPVNKKATFVNDVKSFFSRLQEKLFKPIQETTSIKASETISAEKGALKTLDQMGVKVEKSDLTTYIEDDIRNGTNEMIQDVAGQEVKAGNVYYVSELPVQKGSRSLDTPALLHPEMEEYKQKLEAMGYRLTVDTSLPLSGAGAYFWGKTKVIALRPSSSWSTFIHEFQHAEFDKYASHAFWLFSSAIPRGMKTEGRTLQSVLSPHLPAHRIKKLEELISKEIPENAVNEILSVDEQLRLMGWRRYIPLLGTQEKKYALRHLITDLMDVEKYQPLSAIQKKTLSNAKLQYAGILASEIGSPGAVTTVGTLITKKVMANDDFSTDNIESSPQTSEQQLNDIINQPEKDPNSYLQIVYDQSGNILAQKSDGGWVKISGK